MLGPTLSSQLLAVAARLVLPRRHSGGTKQSAKQSAKRNTRFQLWPAIVNNSWVLVCWAFCRR